MEYYIFAATAIPALFVGLGLLKKQRGESRKHALGRTALRFLLCGGEISAVMTLAVGHDGYVAVVFTALAMLTGAAVLIAPHAVEDIRKLGLSSSAALQIAGVAFLAVVAYSTHRWSSH